MISLLLPQGIRRIIGNIRRSHTLEMILSSMMQGANWRTFKSDGGLYSLNSVPLFFGGSKGESEIGGKVPSFFFFVFRLASSSNRLLMVISSHPHLLRHPRRNRRRFLRSIHPHPMGCRHIQLAMEKTLPFSRMRKCKQFKKTSTKKRGKGVTVPTSKPRRFYGRSTVFGEM